MAYLRNPGGKIVTIDDAEYERWLGTTGFSRVTQDEIDKYIKMRMALAESTRVPVGELPKEYVKGVYISTVAEGGKDGYGVASEKIVKELVNTGIDISRQFSNQKIGFLFHNPYSILKLESPIKVLYTMFESSKIPDDWVDYLKAADKVLVPSKWCQMVFKKAGIDTDVVPLGYDEDVYTYQEKHNRREKKEVFTFLHYNAFNIRKGFPEVFKAFVKEFEKDEPVKLILKTTLPCPPIPIRKEYYPNIEIIAEKYSEREMNDLLHKSDCFVYPSRGEGFGMTPLEAMATGTPTIVPNAHGITEYFDEKYMYKVKVKEECPALYLRYKGEDVGKMVICSVRDLRKQMRWIYEHQDEAIEKGRMASQYVKKYTFKKTAESLKNIFNSLYVTEIKDKKNSNELQLTEVI